MSEPGATGMPAEGVEFQTVLVEALGRLRESSPERRPPLRRLEGRELRVPGDAATLGAYCDRLLAAALSDCDPDSSCELSLHGLAFGESPRRPAPPPGQWLRLALRTQGSMAEDASAFDRAGLPFAFDVGMGLPRPHPQAWHHQALGLLITLLYFPIVGSPRQIPQLRAPARVLFVDDERMILDVHRQSIESLGYEVVESADPRAALELFRRHADAFDLVLSDRSMPGLSGDELTRELRAIRPEIPVVLSTGLATAPGEGNTDAGDAVAFLAKPFTLEELSRSLATGLSSR